MRIHRRLNCGSKPSVPGIISTLLWYRGPSRFLIHRGSSACRPVAIPNQSQSSDIWVSGRMSLGYREQNGSVSGRKRVRLRTKQKGVRLRTKTGPNIFRDKCTFLLLPNVLVGPSYSYAESSNARERMTSNSTQFDEATKLRSNHDRRHSSYTTSSQVRHPCQTTQHTGWREVLNPFLLRTGGGSALHDDVLRNVSPRVF